jgi:hypothetical protein
MQLCFTAGDAISTLNAHKCSQHILQTIKCSHLTTLDGAAQPYLAASKTTFNRYNLQPYLAASMITFNHYNLQPYLAASMITFNRYDHSGVQPYWLPALQHRHPDSNTV